VKQCFEVEVRMKTYKEKAGLMEGKGKTLANDLISGGKHKEFGGVTVLSETLLADKQ
jgi:hypothetical protein